MMANANVALRKKLAIVITMTTTKTGTIWSP
jgi:hypothetical protein